MNIFVEIENKIKNIILSLDKRIVDPDIIDNNISVVVPKNSIYGDLSTNIAIIISKILKINSKVFAEKISHILSKETFIQSINVIEPGFINIKLKNIFWKYILNIIIKMGKNYGKSTIGKNKKINLEYVSANPTGPLHVGHCRGAIIGDVLANILIFSGYKVYKEYYVNDVGKQIDILTNSVFIIYCKLLGREIKNLPKDFYFNSYLKDIGLCLYKKFGKNLLYKDKYKTLLIIKKYSIEKIIKKIKTDLESVGVYHDLFFFESILYENNKEYILKSIDILKEGGYIYHGNLPTPKSIKYKENIISKEYNKQIILKSIDIGDESDRSIKKPDGSYTYLASDIAYIKNKCDRGFEEMIYVLGADHIGYIKRLQYAYAGITNNTNKLNIIIYQLVRLFRKNEQIRMSKRNNNFITLKNIVDEVGKDSVRFMMIYRSANSTLDFDFHKVIEKSKDNPVFYVQYAYARCCSIFRKAKYILNITKIDNKNLINNINLLNIENELPIIRKLIEYPNLIKISAIKKEPHRLVFYLYELASIFHSYWNKGNIDCNLRFIHKEEKKLTFAKLALVKAISNVILSGLKIIGVSAPKNMNNA